MTTCAWLDSCRVCAIKTVMDQDEFVYCEFDPDDMSECPKYREYTIPKLEVNWRSKKNHEGEKI